MNAVAVACGLALLTWSFLPDPQRLDTRISPFVGKGNRWITSSQSARTWSRTAVFVAVGGAALAVFLARGALSVGAVGPLFWQYLLSGEHAIFTANPKSNSANVPC